jgi:hypothetical protein
MIFLKKKMSLETTMRQNSGINRFYQFFYLTTSLLLMSCGSNSPLQVTQENLDHSHLVTSQANKANTLEIDITLCPDGLVWREVDGQEDRGQFFPEEASTYFGLRLPTLSRQGQYYEIRGRYPNARFFSFQSYSPDGDPISSQFDFRVAASLGSRNPISGIGSGPGDNYIIQAKPGFPATSSPLKQSKNLLYLGDSEEKYRINYRVYANDLGSTVPIPPKYEDNPRQWEKQGQQDLPRVYYVVEAGVTPEYTSREEVCSARASQDPTPGESYLYFTTPLGDLLVPAFQESEPGANQLAANPPEWFTFGTLGELLIPLTENFPWIQFLLKQSVEGDIQAFPNSASSYLSTFINSDYGQLTVVRFKAPTFPDTDAGEAINPRIQQTRFWSFCLNNPVLLYTSSCLQDKEFQIDPDGYATVVFSWPAARPLDPKTGAPVKNWLPLSSPITLVLYRHMLPSPHFVNSHFYYRNGCNRLDRRQCQFNTRAISTWMKEYYPVTRYCSKQTFEVNRCEQVLSEQLVSP